MDPVGRTQNRHLNDSWDLVQGNNYREVKHCMGAAHKKKTGGTLTKKPGTR